MQWCAAGGGLCPPGGQAAVLLWHTRKEGARGGTMGSPTLNEWGYSFRLVDLVGRLLP
jgi:hypothetical protein